MNKHHLEPSPSYIRLLMLSWGLAAMQICPTHVWTSLPVDGEHHFLDTALDLVLGLYVSHAICRFTVNSDDLVSDAEVGLGGFTSRCDLQNRSSFSLFKSS